MKFYIGINKEISFDDDYSHGLIGKFASVRISHSKCITPSSRQTESERELNEIFKSMLNPCYNREIVVSVLSKRTENGRKDTLQLFDKSGFLQSVATLYGINNVSVKANYRETPKKYARYENGVHVIVDLVNRFETEEMKILNDKDTTCEGFLIENTGNSWIEQFYKPGTTIVGYITIEVSLFPKSEPEKMPKVIKYTNPLYEKMLTEEICSDTVIIAANGQPIKCHKAVLLSCSDVFATMFKTDMIEARTNQVEMPDMSEEAVRAFLAFVYCLDDTLPSSNCQVAVELLNAAHKYNVSPDMEGALSCIFLAKPADWYDVKSTLKLFQLSRNLPSGESLKMRAVGILRENFKQLLELPAYKEMFKVDLDAGMELCQLFACHL